MNIMLKTEDLVEYVRRTNPNMDKKKLLEELEKSDSSASSLIREWLIYTRLECLRM